MRLALKVMPGHEPLLRLAVALGVALVLSVGFGSTFAAAGRAAAVRPEAEFIVNSTGDDGDGSPGDGSCDAGGGACTLRAALDEANYSGEPVTIRFDLALPATIALGEVLKVGTSASIEGPETGTLTLDGQNNTRHFDIESSGGEPVAISIRRLSLINGRSGGDGGSVIVRYTDHAADVSFERVIFQGNRAEVYGGAIYSEGLDVRVVDSLFTENTADSGGAIANVGGSLRLERSTLAGNEATYGGALFNTDLASVSRHGVMTVTVSTLTGNEALLAGGALYNARLGSYAAATWVRGGTIVSNRVTGGVPSLAGGGVYNGDKSTLVLHSTILAGNTHGGEGESWNDCVSVGGGVDINARPMAAGPTSYLTGGDNLVGAGTSYGCTPSPGDMQLDPALLFVDVLHDELRSYDGSQPMFALRPDSPAIDRTLKGSQLCGTDALALDQRGAPKPLGPACDTGAYEAALPDIRVARTLNTDPRSCMGEPSLELATGALVYSCAVISNTGNVPFTRTVVAAPESTQPFILTQPLAPGQTITLTASQLPALGARVVTGDLTATVTGQGESQWSTPPGREPVATGRGISLARSVDVTMQVSGDPYIFGAIRTVTATVTYHEDGQPVPDRLVQLTVSGGTEVQLPPQYTNAQGQAVFRYHSFSVLLPPTGAGRGPQAQGLRATLIAPEATDFLQLWVDLNGNGVRDGFEPFTAAGLPTAITLASFEAQAGPGRTVVLTWRTASEVDVAGYNVHRAAGPEGPYGKVNAELVASHGTGLGGDYEYMDRPNAAGTYYYKLEEVGTDGSQVMHGPVAVEVFGAAQGEHRTLLPWVAR